MELLKVYAHRYVACRSTIETFIDIIKRAGPGEDARDYKRIGQLRDTLRELLKLCHSGELPVTELSVVGALMCIDKAKDEDGATVNGTLVHFLEQAASRLEDELSTKLFLQLPHSRKDLFEKPLSKWESVTDRFTATINDIEETGKCFALSRYAASVFHSVQIIEHGLLALGEFLSVKDPISGWTAVSNELRRITNLKYSDRSDFERKHFTFIEQMHGTVEALKNAWRNKISHAQGQQLLLVSTEFTPDTADEIITATRAFMRRLAEELPEKESCAQVH